MCCSVLQCEAVCCSEYRRSSRRCGRCTLAHLVCERERSKTKCILQCVAECCRVLQSVAVSIDDLLDDALDVHWHLLCVRAREARHIVCCSVLQCAAEYCSVLQLVAVCCSGLRRLSHRCGPCTLAYPATFSRPFVRERKCVCDRQDTAYVAVCCSVLHAECLLQHVAMNCSMPTPLH